MTSSLVGSEMCIRDRHQTAPHRTARDRTGPHCPSTHHTAPHRTTPHHTCLLYTSDAADDM
eukprot:4254069-Prorocentrum_lima.AAC.1